MWIVTPKTVDHGAYLNIIKNLPEIDVHFNYGLPANIDRAMQKEKSQAVITQLKLLVWMEIITCWIHLYLASKRYTEYDW